MKILCVIPCGNKKIWDKHPHLGAVEAKDAYIGTFHNLCEQYAKAFDYDWVILSAKYGFLRPKDKVPGNYDLSFNHKSNEIITTEQLRQQTIEKDLVGYDKIVVLTGKKYVKVMESVYNTEEYKIEFPLLTCKGIGFMQQKLKQAIENKQPIKEEV